MIMLLQRIAIVLTVVLVAAPVQPPPGEQLDPVEVRQQLGWYGCLDFGVIPTDPARWDEKFQTIFFGNMPKEYRPKYLEAFAKLREANRTYWKERAELFATIHPLFEPSEIKGELKRANETAERAKKEYEDALTRNHPEIANARVWSSMRLNRALDQRRTCEAMLNGDYTLAAEDRIHWHEMRHLWWNKHRLGYYPEWRDPEKQTEYWNALAEEVILLCEKTTEACQQQTEEQKKRIDEFKKLPIDEMLYEDLPNKYWRASSFRGGFHATLPLTDEQKLRMKNDEPVLLTSESGDEGFRFADYEFLTELRDAEREAWKIEETPELATLAIDQTEVARWDGSYSLHPLIRAIAERIEGIDMKPLQTSVGLGVQGGAGFGTVIGGERVETTLSLPQLPSMRSRIVAGMGRGEIDVVDSTAHPALNALIRGEKDIVFSVQLSQAEIDDAQKGEKEVELVMVPFAKDALVFLQNRQNPVRGLTREQYREVLGGKLTFWKEAGGFGGEIESVQRYENFGNERLVQALLALDAATFEAFRSKSYDAFTGTMGGFISGSGGERHVHLERTPGSIAFSSYHYDRYMAPSTLSRAMAVDGVFPSADTIESGEYPLVYECVLVHRKDPGEKIERFVQWLLSDEGQRLVRSVGYVPK